MSPVKDEDSSFDELIENDPTQRVYPEVLVVDDEPINIMVISQMLHHSGVPLTTCTNGEEALESMRRRIAAFAKEQVRLPKLILLDF